MRSSVVATAHRAQSRRKRERVIKSVAAPLPSRGATNLDLKKRADMDREEREDKTTYRVFVNDEGRYSIWPADRENLVG